MDVAANERSDVPYVGIFEQHEDRLVQLMESIPIEGYARPTRERRGS
jgi:hypothetical protein